MNQKALEQQFEMLMNEHAVIIGKVCRMYKAARTDREDLYQEIVLQAWKSFRGFRAESAFSTWLYRVAINTAITDLQQHSRRMPTDPIDTIEDALLPDESQAENERLPNLHEAIRRLNDVERAIIMLFLEDFSYAEMEKVLGIREDTLRVKMNRIKNKLKKLTHDVG